MTITWEARYDDGTALAQADGHAYGDIDRERLAAFDLVRDGALLVRVDLRDDARDGIGPRRLVWRKRNFLDSRGNHMVVHLAGWQRTVAGRNVQAICYVAADGSVLLGGQFGDGLPFGDPVVPLECEAVPDG